MTVTAESIAAPDNCASAATEEAGAGSVSRSADRGAASAGQNSVVAAQPTSYGNFRNPLGLVYRMLKSGRRSAYAALFREALGKMTVPFDLLASVSESKRIRNAPAEISHPVVLIIGPPRSGTTLIYQALAYSLDVAFPNNLSAMFPRSPITARRMAGKRRRDFRSYYGQTSRMSGPNDAFHLWNRWLGSDRYNAATDLSPETIADMKRFFAAWTSAFQKPFLNKNNRNVDCAAFLAKHIPSACFVAVRRDPVCVARSLIRARETVQGDKRIGWGLQCQENCADTEPLGYVRDVCEQVKSNELSLDQQISEIGCDRVVEFTYERFCSDPDSCISDVTERIPGLSVRPGAEAFGPDFFRLSESRPLSDAEERLIHAGFAV